MSKANWFDRLLSHSELARISMVRGRVDYLMRMTEAFLESKDGEHPFFVRSSRAYSEISGLHNRLRGLKGQDLGTQLSAAIDVVDQMLSSPWIQHFPGHAKDLEDIKRTLVYIRDEY